jgi:nicotinamidase/pyrazinamidase
LDDSARPLPASALPRRYDRAVPEYDPATALIVVDVQNDFADPAGSLAVRRAGRIVPRINDEVAAAEQAGATVVYTQDWHPESTPHFAKDGGIWPVHCLADSWGAELHPDLVVRGEVIRKGSNGEDGYSGFTMRDPASGAMIPTPLEGMLRDRGVSRVVICGLATDYCVNATALDARRLGFDTQVLMNAVAAVNLQPGDGERAMTAMADAGAELVGG